MQINYLPKNVCATFIEINISEDNTITSINVQNGCNGNLQGISRLLEGMNIDDAIEKLSGICCNGKNTSCPDQISIALRSAKAKILEA